MLNLVFIAYIECFEGLGNIGKIIVTLLAMVICLVSFNLKKTVLS